MARHVSGLFVITLMTLTVDVRTEVNIHDSILHAFGVAKAEIDGQHSLNEELYRTGIDSGSGSGSFGHNRMLNMFGHFKRERQPEAEKSAVLVRATRELRNIYGGEMDDMVTHPVISSLWMSFTGPYCTPRRPQCGPGPYRTADGSCNNLKHPTWGMANRGQKRYLPPHYANDIDMPRVYSVIGEPLPSPRLVSNLIHRPMKINALEPRDSIMVMQWGQLLDHDIVDTPMNKGFDGADIMCCNLPRHLKGSRAACFTIDIPPGDPVFKKTCMNFVRSVPASHDACMPSRREQLNQASSYIDAGYLYGVDEESSRQLRAYSHGFMKMNDGGFYFPDQNQDKCMREKRGDYCMKSGDNRLHVVPGLASTQILMLREHNRIARILGKINRHWDDERIYQETRKIIIALNQQITYGEYLERVIGPSNMEFLGLYIKPKGYNTVYRPEVDATMANCFAVAAFRFGHTQIPGNVNLFYKNTSRVIFDIEETFNRPFLNLAEGGRGNDHINRWMINEPSGRNDRFLEPGVQDKLFLDKRGNSFDLASLNIQRGRDHGVPGYNAWRKWCDLPVSHSFLDMPDLDPETLHSLAKAYSHPNDIDIFTGGLAERHVFGGSVGPTFSCILGRQFKEMRYGDRFWYENDFRATGFTIAQLNSIKTQRLSNILCNNQPDKFVPVDSFSVPSVKNPHVPCASLPEINFWLWQEMPKGKKIGAVRPPFAAMSKYSLY